MRLNEKNIDDEIKYLNNLKRKIRNDKGEKRVKYNSNLDKKYITYLKRANAKGLQFDLTEQHFKDLENCSCYYCDVSNPSGFDRIDSKYGYILNNVVPCCFRCNIMKHTMKQGDFYAHIFQIAKITQERIDGFRL